jgi:outer membrane protein assembly factor BamB
MALELNSKKWEQLIVVLLVFLMLIVSILPSISSTTTIYSESMDITDLGQSQAHTSAQQHLQTDSQAEDDIYPIGSRSLLEWKYQTSENSYISTPALVDLDLDGYKEVVFLTDGDSAYALSHTGSFLWKNTNFTISRADEFMTSTFYYLKPIFSSITPADIADDKRPELLFGADEKVVCLDATGSQLWAKGDADGYYISTPVVTDLHGVQNSKKSDSEIVVLKDISLNDLNPQIFSSKGGILATLEEPSVGSNVGMASVAAMDLDGSTRPDANKDIIFGSHYSPMYLYSNDTEEYEKVSISGLVSCLIYGTGAIGDFVGDEECEYFVGSYEGSTGLQDPANAVGVYYLYDPINASGSAQEDFRLWVQSPLTAGTGFLGSPVVGDVHGGLSNPRTGKVGYEGFLGSYDGRLYCIDINTGNRLWSFDTGSPIYSAPALCDINSDTYLEVIVASNNGVIYCFDGDPGDNVDEGISDSGGTNYDILWQYDTKGNGTWVSSPVVADIDNDKELEVVVGDIDGTVWCLSAGAIKLKGQTDWPMFQHDSQNTGFFPMKSYSIDVKLKLQNGDGQEQKTCYTQYHPYKFQVEIIDGLSYADLETVVFTLDPGDKNVQCQWSRDTGEFIEINDPHNYIELFSTPLDSNTDFINTWTLDFNISFNWNFDTDSLTGIGIQTTNHINPEKNLIFSDFVQIENQLEYFGNLDVEGELQGKVLYGDWIRGGEELQWSNITIVYKDTDDIYPDPSKFILNVSDHDTYSSTIDYNSAGSKIIFFMDAQLETDSEKMYYLDVLPISPGAAQPITSLGFKLKIDGTPPIAPEYVYLHSDSFSDPNIISDNDTVLYATWTSSPNVLSGIKGYYYGPDLKNMNYNNFTTENKIKIDIGQTDEITLFVWPLDNVGNIGNSSSGSTFIDLNEVEFSSLYPTQKKWFNTTTIKAGVTISDKKGIGVDTSTIQYSILSPSVQFFGQWQAINQKTDIEQSSPNSVQVNSKVTFTENGLNQLKWRAKDLAGNGFTYSENISIKIDSAPPQFSSHDFSPADTKDLRWVECNITLTDTGGSRINGSSIEYKISTWGVNNYTDWKSAEVDPNNLDENVKVVLYLNYGSNNYIYWRATDYAGHMAETKDNQIQVNIPPIPIIKFPINNSKYYFEDDIKFDATGSNDPDDADRLSYFWITTYTSNVGQQISEPIGNSKIIENTLKSGSNKITLYVNDGNYNVSTNIIIFVYNQFTDLDKDGLPDWYEEQYTGLNPDNPNDAKFDLDGDGVDNLNEFQAQTNPADPDDYPGKKVSKTDDDEVFFNYLLINIIFLIIIIIILGIVISIKRSKIKKERFSELQASTPSVRLRSDRGGSSSLPSSKPPQVIPQTISRSDLEKTSPAQVPKQEVYPSLPPKQTTDQVPPTEEPTISQKPTEQQETSDGRNEQSENSTIEPDPIGGDN